MITIKPIKRSDELVGFEISGHANFAPYGSDIVCAAVSVMSINTVNSLTELAKADVDFVRQEGGGYMKFTVKRLDEGSKLLLASAMLGYDAIADMYDRHVMVDKS